MHTFIFLGIRVLCFLLNLYKYCGFYLQKEIKELTPPNKKDISSLIISNTFDKKDLGLVKSLTLTLIPVDGTRQLNLYNESYKTGLPYSTELSYQQIIPLLKNWQINFIW